MGKLPVRERGFNVSGATVMSVTAKLYDMGPVREQAQLFLIGYLLGSDF